jgi:hypothetical protein
MGLGVIDPFTSTCFPQMSGETPSCVFQAALNLQILVLMRKLLKLYWSMMILFHFHFISNLNLEL